MTDVDLKNALMAGEAEDDGTDETGEVTTKAGVVVVRGLSREEILILNGSRDSGKIDAATWERKVFALCLVSPTMTEDEVAVWMKASKVNGTAGKVANKIYRLSGLAEGADKSGVPEAGDE